MPLSLAERQSCMKASEGAVEITYLTTIDVFLGLNEMNAIFEFGQILKYPKVVLAPNDQASLRRDKL